ncbi:MAG: hypothetical protein ACKO7P_00280 [Bacteroidota bacterium]
MILFAFFGFIIFHCWISQMIYFAQKTSEGRLQTNKIKSWKDFSLVYKNQNLIKQQEILDKLEKEKPKVDLKSDLDLVELNINEELFLTDKANRRK